MTLASVVLIVMSPFPGSLVKAIEVRFAQIFETPTVIVVARHELSQPEHEELMVDLQPKMFKAPTEHKPRKDTESKSAPMSKKMFAILPTVPRLGARFRSADERKRTKRMSEKAFWSERLKTEFKKVMFARTGKRHA